MYGVIGACESSTTIANDLVGCAAPCGAPDQYSGGLSPAPWQVYCRGMLTSALNTGLVTVIACGAPSRWVVRPPSSPQPLSSTQASAAPSGTGQGPATRYPGRLRQLTGPATLL